MRRFAIAVALATGMALVSFVAVSAVSTFTVTPWAYACGKTTTTNPAIAHDPGEAGCPHPDNGGKSYCANGDELGETSAAYAGGKLTLTKSGPICDDMASGATIGGLSTLTSASANCLTPSTCNPGGNLRLNVVDSSGKLHFIGGTMSEGHITFSVGELEGLTLKSINIIADNPGTVALDSLSFVGAPTPTPTPTATPTPTPSASATAHPTATPRPTVAPTPTVILAQTGGGSPLLPLAILLGALLVAAGGTVALRRR